MLRLDNSCFLQPPPKKIHLIKASRSPSSRLVFQLLHRLHSLLSSQSETLGNSILFENKYRVSFCVCVRWVHCSRIFLMQPDDKFSTFSSVWQRVLFLMDRETSMTLRRRVVCDKPISLPALPEFLITVKMNFQKRNTRTLSQDKYSLSGGL